MYKKLSTIILFAAIVFSVNANSIFSFKQFPERSPFADIYSIGMGGAGIGDLQRINNNYANPSLSVSTDKVTFSSAVTMAYTYYDDNTNSFRDNMLEIPYFNIIVPIKDNRFSFNFNKFLSGNVQNQNQTDDYLEKQIIDSYIYNVDFGYAYRNKYLNVGINARVYLGHHTHQFEQDFDDDEMLNTKFERYNEFNSTGINFGFSKKIKNFSFGGFYSTAVTLEGKSELIYSENIYSQEFDDVEIELPATMGFGLTYKSKNRIKYAFDVEFENWKNTNSYENSAENSYIFKGGIAYEPLLGYGEWWQRIPLRIGANYRNLPFKINNNAINEIGGSIGFSVPLKRKYQKIDFAIELKKRGNIDDHDLEESSIMLNIGIQGFDIFQKRYNRTRKLDIPEADKWSN